MQRRNLDPRANSAGRDSIDLDIERGLQLQELRSQRPAAPIATTSAHSRNQSAATSNATDGNGDDLEDEWNDSHPCYPHRNPYVPHGSPLYEWTRIIRVPRDFMLNGDITPGFSNIYPQIMEPYVSEEQFRTIIGKVNRDLREAFDPFNWRNILDGVLGVMTCWLWEDIKPGGTFTKRKLEGVEEFLEDMSRELRRESGEKGVDIISLRRTGYANVSLCKFGAEWITC
ncbi:hypothetical protein BJ508DRAFT_211918 [Ascobolus immersus RN42]|uniref:Ras modification protein ERF4 n=1 Tax=Ascobolus immersus RN42 TaxID=1160509 RepID=A0A3N4HY02_ASCIM|nr:hypothetical protein BJ508DRAFT_211918 [Ascobolus immersus RN42]